MTIDREDLTAFLVETKETLSQIETDLVIFEQNPEDLELINRLYRSFHTLKGNCAFLSLAKLEAIAHGGENLLNTLRAPTARESSSIREIINILLRVVDIIKQITIALESTGAEGEEDYSELIAAIDNLQDFDSSPSATIADPQAETPPAQSNQEGTKTSGLTDNFMRVDVQRLDELMNLVGELVLCRNQIVQFSDLLNDSSFLETAQRLDLITTDLQEGLRKTRMQPISTVWSKFPRVVRDLSLGVGKQVSLELEGEDTELDKTLIETISDPLTHLIRNCIDHGIETPDLRQAIGKPPEGKLFLRAFHESGYVKIQVADDGAGIDLAALKARAIELNLIAADRAAALSEQETLNLIFHPGLSTAKQVTNLSGRGVGMDVVKTNINKIEGNINISSQPNKGTVFTIEIPLSLAIARTLLVTSGGDRYAIPQMNLLELIRLEGEQAVKSVEMIHGSPVYRLRGQLIPLIYLNEQLQLDQNPNRAKFKDCSDDRRDGTLNIVVLQARDYPFGLVVDAINDIREIVVKPLGKQLKQISCFAGATIMGDGRVALILDIQGLAEKAHVISDDKEIDLNTESNIAGKTNDEECQMLLLQGLDNRRMGIALSRVARLENFSPQAIERIGQKKVLQYRDRLLDLIDLSAILNPESVNSISDSTNQGLLQVVVVNLDRERNVGIIVENIIDIVDQRITVKSDTDRAGIEYAAVIQGKVTEIIDIEALIAAA
ncbi:MAG: chemotaxis protein CheA [Prochloraceae cyanobacterium]|nr:chemotaxis protein CheA [Prochloraceae cyanobacterium]